MGVERLGYRRSLSHIAEGEWRARFSVDPMISSAGYGVAATPLGGGAPGGVDGGGTPRVASPMDFRLHYRGPLKANGTAREKQTLRRAFHPQLETLWSQPPLDDQRLTLLACEGAGTRSTLLYPVGPFMFTALISSRLGLTADIDILFLPHQRAGELVGSGGDIDNRLKTLFDALSVPNLEQIKGRSLSTRMRQSGFEFSEQTPPPRAHCAWED